MLLVPFQVPRVVESIAVRWVVPVTAGAWVIAGEYLTALQIAGTCTIAAALTAIVFAGGRLTRADLPATGAALLTGVTIAAYTVVDGLGVRHAHNSVGYLALLFVFQQPAILAIAAYRLRHRLNRELLGDVPAGLAAGAISVLAYGIVVWAQTRGPLALVSALRETSVISAALIATQLFKEPFARRRLRANAVRPNAVLGSGGALFRAHDNSAAKACRGPLPGSREPPCVEGLGVGRSARPKLRAGV